MAKKMTFSEKRRTTSFQHLTHPPKTRHKEKTMSSKKKSSKKDKVKIAIRYGVAIPERALMDLLRLDCAGALVKFSKEFAEWSPKEILERMKGLGEVFNVTSAVLDLIQSSWQDALQEYAENTKLPKNFYPAGCKPAKTAKGKKGLTEQEQRKVRALRKQGLSIKAIGKELHRAEKVVADFVRTLPKK